MFWEEPGGCKALKEGVEVGGNHSFISSLISGILSSFPGPVLEPVSAAHGQQLLLSHLLSLPATCWAAAKWERKGTTLYQREALNGAWMGSKEVAP